MVYPVYGIPCIWYTLYMVYPVHFMPQIKLEKNGFTFSLLLTTYCLLLATLCRRSSSRRTGLPSAYYLLRTACYLLLYAADQAREERGYLLLTTYYVLLATCYFMPQIKLEKNGVTYQTHEKNSVKKQAHVTTYYLLLTAYYCDSVKKQAHVTTYYLLLTIYCLLL